MSSKQKTNCIKYGMYASTEQDSIVAAFHKFFNQLQDPTKPNPKELNTFIKLNVPQYV